MVPRDLNLLIEKYNEQGIYFVKCGQVWWVNNKRFEKICTCSEIIISIKVINNKMYGNDFFNYLYSLNGIKMIADAESYKHAVKVGDNIYNYNSFNFFKMIEKNNEIKLPLKTFAACGNFLCYYNSYLYYFDKTTNEKFNIFKKQWELFAANNLDERLHDVKLLRNLFYIYHEDDSIFTYDPKTDAWAYLFTLKKFQSP